MELTRKTLTGDGSTTLYNVNFSLGYIDTDYVFVYLDGNEKENQLQYVWRNNNQIELNQPVANGVKFYIRRVIPRNMLVNNYSNGALLRETNLNNSYLQTLMILEEIQDGFWRLDSNDMEFLNSINLNNNRILNLPEPIEDTEPSRKVDLETVNTTLVNLITYKENLINTKLDTKLNVSGDSMSGVLNVLESQQNNAAVPLKQIKDQIATQFTAYDPNTYIDYGLVTSEVGNTQDYGSIN